MALSETSATPDSHRLLEAVPAGRTCESLRHHHECENAIALRLYRGLLPFLLPSNVVAVER